MAKQRKPEAEVLFPETAVGGYVVRPWSMGKVIELDPEFRELIQRAKDSGLTFERFSGIVSGDGTPDLETFYEIFSVFAPVMPRLTSKTLGISVEEATELGAVEAVEIALTILVQNVGVIKNLYGPGRVKRVMTPKAG
jgi:hypothetical protein